MGKTEGITKWECDRCGEKYFAPKGDNYAKEWGQPKRINSSLDEATCTLCPTCLSEYKMVVAAHDKDFASFLKGEK